MVQAQSPFTSDIKKDVATTSSTSSTTTNPITTTTKTTTTTSTSTTSSPSSQMKTKILHPVAGYEEWYYKDYANIVHGPFRSEVMLQWDNAGYFR